MKKILFILFFGIFVCGTAFAADPIDPIELLDERRRMVGDMMEAATVLVVCKDSDGDWGLGSGFVVADGYIMTNGHVVDDAQKIFVMNGQLKPTAATLVNMSYKGKTDGEDDFALLNFSSNTKLPVLVLNTQVKRMDRVSAWGFGSLTLQFDRSFGEVLNGNFSKLPPVVYTEGTVNALVADGKRTNIIHTASIARGNSGGPLVNGRGEVVGINTWGALDEVDGLLNASLPADRILAFINSCGVGAQVARGNQRPQLVERKPLPRPVNTPPKQSDSEVVILLNEEARQALEKAKEGDVDAQTFVGVSYYDGSDGFPVNIEEAVKWLESAAKQKNKIASGMLGIICLSEEKYFNPKRALELLRTGGDAMPEFQYLLSWLYYEGEFIGIKRNEAESFTWASMAASGGDADGKAQLAVLYYYGEGVEMDREKGLALAQEAAELDSSLGKAILAWIYFYGTVVDENLDRALELAQSAAEEDEPTAQGLLAIMYYMGNGVSQDLKRAEGWARRAADKTNEFGQYILGLLYMNGDVVEKDLPTAWAYLDIAGDKGIEDAHKQRDIINKQMNAAQRKKAISIQKEWKKEWGI